MLLQSTKFVALHFSANTINKCFSLNELGNFKQFINRNSPRFPYEVTGYIWPRFLYWVTIFSYSHLAPPSLLSHLTQQTPWENKGIYILHYQRGKGQGMWASKSKRKRKPRKIVLFCPSLTFHVLSFGFPFIRNLWLLFSHGPLEQVIA